MLIAPGALVTMKFIEANTGYKKSYLYNQIAKGNLAKPIKRGYKSLWKLEDVQRFQKTMLDEADHH